MREQDALHIVEMLQMYDRYAKHLSGEQLVEKADVLRESAPGMDYKWAQRWIRVALSSDQPVDMRALLHDWAGEARRRINSAQIPTLPEHIESDPALRIAWMRQWRKAIIEGATEKGAIQIADRAEGMSTYPQIERWGGPRDSEQGKAELKEILNQMIQAKGFGTVEKKTDMEDEW